ncbi:MAG: hypothetical protein NVS3B14_06440 [Ktedonobacteraceae bacterium]
MVAIPVAMQFLQVEIVALHGLLTVLDDLDRSFVERNGGQSWERSQALLTSSITGIDFHVIDVHWHSAKPADSVHHEERAVRVRDALQFLQGLPEPG